jgi:hypothetical protein
MPELGRPMLSRIVCNSSPGIFLSQDRFDLITEPRRLLHPQPGAGAHMQAQQSGIYLGKEVFSEKREQPERQQAECEKADYEDASIFKSGFQQRLVAAAEVFKFPLEAALKAAQERLGPSARCSCPRMMYITRVGMSVRESR